MRIAIHRTLAADDCERFVKIHREAFAPLAELSAVRQSLTDEEFRAELAHPEVLKFLGIDAAGEAAALALVTNELSRIPWINESFYAKEFPDQYSRNAIFYFFTFLVAPEAQGGPWVTAMIEALSMHTAIARGVVAFDCCDFNVNEMAVPELIRGISSKYVEADYREVDAQHYYAYEFLSVRSLDLRTKRDHGIEIDLTVPALVSEPIATEEIASTTR